MKRALILLLSILTVPVVQAQGQGTDRKANAAAVVENTVVDPTLTSGGRGTAPAVTFQFSKDDNTATAQIGGGMGTSSRWGLTVGGPLSKSSPRTTLATNEALNSGFNAELLFRKIFLGDEAPIPALEFADICRRFLQRNQCTRADLPAAGKRELDAKAFPPTWTIGGSAKVGRKKFDFTTPTVFNDQSETHEGSSFSLAGGVFPGGSLLYYVGGSFRYESAFVGGDVKNVCTPISMSTSIFCRDIAIGAPQRRTANLLQLEARSFLGEGVGLAPRVTYETEKRVWSIEVPIYLRQGEGPFNGGVNVGWDSKNHEVVVSLFVGALPRLIQ